jgi:hypothetical protein
LKKLDSRDVADAAALASHPHPRHRAAVEKLDGSAVRQVALGMPKVARRRALPTGLG